MVSIRTFTRIGAGLALVCWAALVAAAAPDGAGRGDRYAGAPWASRSPVLARHGMAATEQPLASLAAVEILQRGGSAVDAAIAANAVLGVTLPVLNGIGGDAFAIVWDPQTRRLYGYNGSGPAPAGRDLATLKRKVRAAWRKAGLAEKDLIPMVGSLSVTVPGTVDTWFALHAKFGKLPIEEDLAPAIRIAREGFPVTEIAASYWQHNFASFERQARLIEELDNARATYLIDGHAPRQGEVFRNPDLARTLEAIAKGGRAAFYQGGIAERADAYFRRIGADLRGSDFARFHGEWVEPAAVDYRGYQVWELPPNGQGFAALEMLNVLKGFDLAAMGWGSADLVTVMVEAKRLAYEDLAKYYADPRFADVPMHGLLSGAYADARRRLISPARANPDLGPGDPRLVAGDTTNFVVADAAGMMVSMIQSNYAGMGSGLVADGLGFMFQDRGQLFSLHAGDANVYAPGKRPFHTIIPAFVTRDGKPWLAFGVMGGDMQPQAHVQMLVNMIDFGMNVQEAGDAARWRHVGNASPTGEPASGIGSVQLESGFAPGLDAELRARGYEVVREKPSASAFGGYEAIHFDAEAGVYWGATEMRKDGSVVGY